MYGGEFWVGQFPIIDDIRYYISIGQLCGIHVDEDDLIAAWDIDGEGLLSIPAA